ncbi:MAG: FAD-dependent oxidoreductase [Acidimicrobiales bacterium]|nr:FAD-dependent oxidoreductase [Acidimicrobiales bacterium]
MERDIVIVGGGLAGLTAAHRLASAGPRVTVFEGSTRFGGQLHTELTADGVLVELGAEGFVARSVAVPELCAEAELGDQVIGQSRTLTYAATDDGLVALEPGEAARILGFQVPPEELGRGIRSLRRGMGSLTDALVATMGSNVELRLSTEAASLEPSGSGIEVRLVDGRSLRAGAVVVATPARPAARLLATLAGSSATDLASAPLLSNLSVSLVYRRSAVAHPLDASGFIVPANVDGAGVRACSFVSSKFAGRTPDHLVELRVFFRPSAEDLSTLDDQGWVERAHAGVAERLHISTEPDRWWVAPWANALPVHTDDHRATVAAVEASLAGLPVVLAGSAFHGAGIDAAVLSGMRAAFEIQESGALR